MPCCYVVIRAGLTRNQGSPLFPRALLVYNACMKEFMQTSSTTVCLTKNAGSPSFPNRFYEGKDTGYSIR